MLLVLAGLAAVLVGNALRLRPAPRGGPPAAADAAIDAAAAADHLAAVIRFRTISHQDPAQDDVSQLEAFTGYLARTYPRIHATLKHERVGERGILYTWSGSDSAAPPILLMAHADVVPVEPGTEPDWQHPPFSGAIADGFVWGRGAIDDKGPLIAILEAVESLLARTFAPGRTVYFAFGLDEEVGGTQGALRISALLEERGVRLDWVLDEGSAVSSGIFPGVARPVAAIAVSEKGYLSIELLARSEGGHSSMPPRRTTIGRLASAITRLEQQPLPGRLAEPMRSALVRLAPEMGFVSRLSLANLWLLEAAVVRRLSARPATNAWVRTTTAPTIFEAGVKENVLPSSGRAVVNFRLLPGDTTASVLAHVRAVVAQDDVRAEPLLRTMSEPAPVSRADGAGFATIESAVRRAFPDAVVIPGLVGGATDSRHFVPVAGDVYRFAPRAVVPSDLPRIHGTNERTSLADLALMIQVYRDILETAGAR